MKSNIPILVTADDFGIADCTSRLIVCLLDAEVVHRTSIMPCVSGSTDSVSRYRAELTGRAGVHLQLTKGRPILPAKSVPSLVGAKGLFPSSKCEKRPDTNELKSEWRAQIESVIASIGCISHLDSHHGVHLEEFSLQVAEDLAKEFGVALRGPNGYNHGKVTNPIAEYTIGDWTLSGKTSSVLRGIVDGLCMEPCPPSSIEIVTHPGIACSDLQRMTSRVYEREHDLLELLRFRFCDM